MPTTDRALFPHKRQPLLNRVMSRVLRSRMSSLVGHSLMLVTVYGRRSGRPYTLPVQYVQDGDVVGVLVGHCHRKTWWRNLRVPGRVDVVLRRSARSGRGHAYTFADAPQLVEEGVRRYIARFPGTARSLGVRRGDDESVTRVAADMAVVRIVLDA